LLIPLCIYPTFDYTRRVEISLARRAGSDNDLHSESRKQVDF